MKDTALEKDRVKTIYIISGPCGVGKSTVTKELARILNRTVLIEGDVVHGMFGEKDEPSWKSRLSITWENILSLTRNFIQHDLDVLVDYIIEDELSWFCEGASDLNVQIKYVVLRADEETIVSRLSKRGSADLIERSLFLLNQLENDASNKQHLYDTTYKQPVEIVQDIINSSNFTLHFKK